MANPWLKNKRRNWRDNPTMMELYRRAMANKYSPYRRMDLQGQDTVFDYPSALWPQSETVVEEPAFIPRGRTPQSREEVQTIVDTNIITPDGYTQKDVVYLEEGRQIGYLPSEAKEELGW